MLDRRGLLIANSQQGGVLPQGYTRLNYLESTKIQHINTGIKNIYDLFEFHGDIQFTDVSHNQFIGANNDEYFGIYNGNFTQSYKNIMRTPDTDRHIFNMLTDKPNRSVTFSIDEQTGAFAETQFDRFYFYLFAPSGQKTNAFRCSCKIYSAYLKGDNAILWNGIPALDTNNRPCMFDTVTQTPFYNIGTGEFLYG